MPTTIKEAWQDERDASHEALTAASERLREVAAGGQEISQALSAELGESERLRAELRTLWREAGEADSPSEGEAIMQTIRGRKMELRAVEARVRGLEWERAKAHARTRRLKQVIERTRLRHRTAAKAHDEASAEHDRRQLRIVAAGNDPLQLVPTEAGDYLASAAQTAREGEVDAVVPEPLRRSAEARIDLERTRLDYARQIAEFALDQRGVLWQDEGGLIGDAERALLELDRADAELEAWVGSAERRLERATAALDGLDLDVDAAEAAAVAEVPTDAGDALSAETEVLDAEAEVELRRFQLLRSMSQAEVDPSGPRRSAETQARNRLNDAVAVRDAKVADFAPLKSVLDEWQTALADDTWRAYLTFVDETATLQELAATDPQVLIDAVEAAESAAATALAAALAVERGTQQWAEFAEEMIQRVATAEDGSRQRLFGAVSGDPATSPIPSILP